MKIVESFTAREADGTEHTINILQRYHDTSTQYGAGEAPDGLKQIKTDDGHYVNFVGPGRYELIKGTQTIPLTSDDPNAPQS